jgi:hypothetical protein
MRLDVASLIVEMMGSVIGFNNPNGSFENIFSFIFIFLSFKN